MRLALASVVVGLVVPVALTGTAVAAGSRSYTAITVKVAGHVCTNTSINGLENNGTAVGTENCGHNESFIRTASGAVTLYKLPAADAKYTFASSIASNGTVALVGERVKGSLATSYLLTKSGKLTSLQDPKAKGHGTIVDAVNRHGETAGLYCANTACTKTIPFTEQGGVFTSFVLGVTGARNVQLSVMTDSGTVGGFFFTAKGAAQGFLSTNGHVHLVNAPGAGHKSGQGTFLYSGANNGNVAGDVVGSNGGESGWVQIAHKFHVLNIGANSGPKYVHTDILAINGHGEFGGDSVKPKQSKLIGYLAHR
jgi:hypothetical protein